jgi:phage protein D
MLTPVDFARQGLVRAYLEIVRPTVPDPLIPFRFNPTEYQLQKGNNFAEIGIPGLESPPIQFVRGSAEKLTAELLVDTSDRIGPRHDVLIQENQDDALFLIERANRIDFDCYVSIDPDNGRDTLYFTSQSGRDGKTQRVYVFEWGKSLISFNPVLSTADQVSKLTVRGWDQRSKTAISYTAGPDDLEGKQPGGTTGPEVAEKSLGNKQEVVINRPVSTADEARQLAISLLRERSRRFLTAKGQAIGLPDLRPGDQVELRNLGTRFDGTYDIVGVTHTLGSSGYLTEFEVSTHSDGGTKA